MKNCAIAHICCAERIPFISAHTVTGNGTLSGNQIFAPNIDKAAHISMELCGKLTENSA